MNDHAARAKHLNSITERIIGCAFTVGNTLGPGYLEKVYENALAHELRKAGLAVEQQKRMTVWYDGVSVGEYVTDLVVESSVLIEIKAAKNLVAANEAQCLNCLTITRAPLGLLLNFGSRVDIKRLVGPAAPMFSENGDDTDWEEV